MFDFNFGKLLLLAVIALVVIGPRRLPKAARMAGAMLRRARQSWDSVRAEVEREMQVEEVRRTAREAVAQTNAVRTSVDHALKETRASLDESAAEVKQVTRADPPVAEDPDGNA
jgi:sec-independent protein translocase protein TatB